MKKNYFYNLFLIIICICFLGYIIFNSAKYISNKKRVEQVIQTQQKECQTDNTHNEDFCQNVLSSSSEVGDFYVAFYNIFCSKNNPVIIIIIIIILSVYPLSKYFKNNILSNELMRSSYQNIKKRLFKKAYLPVFILPFFCIIALIISYSIYGSFEYNPVFNDSVIWHINLKSKPLLFIFLYIFNLIIHSIIYINISLIIVRKNHNFIIAVILSILSIFGIQLFMEIVIGGIICTSLLRNSYGIIFNIMNFYSYSDYFHTITPIIAPLIVLIITFAILILIYKNKEKLVIDCEKNDGGENED